MSILKNHYIHDMGPFPMYNHILCIAMTLKKNLNGTSAVDILFQHLRKTAL